MILRTEILCKKRNILFLIAMVYSPWRDYARLALENIQLLPIDMFAYMMNYDSEQVEAVAVKSILNFVQQMKREAFIFGESDKCIRRLSKDNNCM